MSVQCTCGSWDHEPWQHGNRSYNGEDWVDSLAPTPDPLPLDPEDHGHTGRLWCDPCVAHGVMLEQGVHRCANTVSSGNGIAPDPLREEALAVVMNEHRKCGPKFDGCYSHFPWTTHCRADGMTWPCDVDRIRAALAAPALRSAVVGPPITGAALVERIREDRLTSTPAPDPLREAALDLLSAQDADDDYCFGCHGPRPCEHDALRAALEAKP